ncbi:ABC transporter permease subunit [Inediibacterium massiliense]|uniref:ABC transporter permease subunit n=1 Tax=Inediibacterium massiliense TaxID=1658111 RepID=UPI0006B562B8|nr:ABC transporter permease subunit [Inediibacterium massiliense]
MNFVTSLFNKNLYKKDIRLNWVFGIVMFGLLFLDLPMSHIRYLNAISNLDPMSYQYTEELAWRSYMITDPIIGESPIQFLILLIFPIMMASFLLGEERRTKTLELLGVMPYKRVQIYMSKVLAGLSIMVVPYILNFGITLLMRSSMKEVAHLYGYADLVHWLYVSLVPMLLFFSFSMLIGMLVGTTIAQAILTVIFMSLPGGFWGLLMMNTATIQDILSIHFNPTFIENIGDIVRFFTLPFYMFPKQIFHDCMDQMDLIMGVLVIAAMIMIFIGYRLFLKNKMERNGEILMFAGLENFFKVGVAICTMLLFGPMLTGILQMYNIVLLIIGYAIGLGLGWFIPNYFIQVNRRA